MRVCEVRGNVGTRLRKLHEHAGWAALVLARAGLERLGYGGQMRAGFLEADGRRFTLQVLPPALMMPAVGQGAIGLQARADDRATLRALAAVNDAGTWAAVTAERTLLSLLGGGCQMPLGVNTVFYPERGQMRLQAVLFDLDEANPPTFGETVWAMDDPAGLAERVARQLV